MPFITTPERHGIEKGIKIGKEEGRREGLLKAIEVLLAVRFGEAARQCLADIQTLSKDDELVGVLRASGTAATLEEARRAWTP